MLRFRQMRSFQKFVAVHSSIDNLLSGDRARTRRGNFKTSRVAALAEWRQLCAAFEIVPLP
jgi:putative transposase